MLKVGILAIERSPPSPSSSASSILRRERLFDNSGDAEMASSKAGRIINFANLPLKLLLPSRFENIKEVAFKTIPSASKIEIKRILESVYGLEVEKVHTLNMEGKKKLNKKSGTYYRRPDYKKAYVVLKNPVSLPRDLFPINAVKEEKDKAGGK